MSTANNNSSIRKAIFAILLIYGSTFISEIAAQNNFTNCNVIAIHTNFLSHSNDFDKYLSSNGNDAPDVFMPSASVSYSFYRSYKRTLFFGATAAFSYGMYDYKNNFRKKEDILCYAESIYRLSAGNFCSVDFGIGFGVAYINAFHVQNNNQLGSFCSTIPILPVTVSMIFPPKSKSNFIGLYLQYIVSFNGNDKMIFQGTDIEISNYHLEPSTLSIGVKYGF